MPPSLVDVHAAVSRHRLAGATPAAIVVRDPNAALAIVDRFVQDTPPPIKVMGLQVRYDRHLDAADFVIVDA